MKGFRFYEELGNKRRKSEQSKGNVVAVLYTNGYTLDLNYVNEPIALFDIVCGLFDEPNSPVCGGQTSDEYLWRNCRRVSEERARQIHPALFEYLDPGLF